MCKKGNQKFYVLAQIAPFMNLKQRSNIMKAFVESQFGYYPLIRMFNRRGLNNEINLMHERVLRITYNNKSSTFQKLLEKDNSLQ